VAPRLVVTCFRSQVLAIIREPWWMVAVGLAGGSSSFLPRRRQRRGRWTLSVVHCRLPVTG
ncbi:hypothetical protein K443DRAFT_670641, partial [Laccaria amethystina LaAM-08-1]